MALADLYNNGQGTAMPSPSPTTQQAKKKPKGPSPFRGLGTWLIKRLHCITLALGLITGGGCLASRVLASDVPTDAAVFSAVVTASRTAPGEPVEGVADIRVGSCRRQVTDDRAGDGAQQWNCSLTYTYARAGARETDSRSVTLMGFHADGRTATVCADCGPPLHFIERGAADRLESGQFVHLPLEGDAK